jgi:hypothetical protein
MSSGHFPKPFVGSVFCMCRRLSAANRKSFLTFFIFAGVVMAEKKLSEPALEANALACAAGLDKAVKQFPEDVAAAARSAVQARSALGAQENVAAEPWPPMRVRSAS